MAISFTRPDPASPASVSAAQFPSSRRGYDQAEVRDFLRMVAAEQARLQERERSLERDLKALQQSTSSPIAAMDEDTATRLLGEEAARILHTAREAATQIKTRADESSARLLRDATDEAQRLRQEAEIEVARRRQDSSADAEAEIQMAKQQGRDMVNEARAYRERVLSELARRREMARQQIEQLIHGRDRLLQAFERSRMAAVEVMAELTPLGEPAEYVNLQATTGPVPLMVPSGAPSPDGATADAPDAEAVAPPQADSVMYDHDQEPAEAAAEEPASAPGPIDPGMVVVADDFRADLHVVVDEDDTATSAADATIGDPPDDTVDEPEAATAKVDDDNTDDENTDDENTDDDNREPAEVVALFAGEIDTATRSGATVEDLFARLRASRVEPAAKSAEPVAPLPSTATEIIATEATFARPAEVETTDIETVSDIAGQPPTDPAASTSAVDESLVPLIVSVARKLKRVLADEQNDLLDMLRRTEPIRSLDALLPWEADQSARYITSVEADLVAAAEAGAQGGENGRNAAIIRPAIDAITNEIVAPLRDRLIRCIDKSEGDNTELANLVRNLYREWKTHRIDEHVEDIVRLAYDRGALTIASR